MSEKTNTKKKLTRKQQRDLDVEICFLEGIVRRDPEFIDALQILGDDYTLRGKIDDGLVVDEQLARLCPEDSLVHYNLACSYTLTRQFDRAVVALDRALALGYNDFNWLAKDPDLRPLREQPAYGVIEARIRRILIKVD